MPNRLSVKDTIIRNCTGGGILVEPTAGTTTAVIDNVRCENSLFGIQTRDRVQCTVNRSVCSNNTNNGFVAVSLAGGASELNIYNCVASNNGAGNNANGGIKSQNAGATVRIQNCMVTDNSGGLVASGGALLSWGGNYVAGNAVDGNPTAAVLPLK